MLRDAMLQSEGHAQWALVRVLEARRVDVEAFLICWDSGGFVDDRSAHSAPTRAVAAATGCFTIDEACCDRRPVSLAVRRFVHRDVYRCERLRARVGALWQPHPRHGA